MSDRYTFSNRFFRYCFRACRPSGWCTLIDLLPSCSIENFCKDIHFFSIKQINRAFFVKIITLFQRSLSFGNILGYLCPICLYFVSRSFRELFVSFVRTILPEREKCPSKSSHCRSVSDPYSNHCRKWCLSFLYSRFKISLSILSILTICPFFTVTVWRFDGFKFCHGKVDKLGKFLYIFCVRLWDSCS